MFKYLDFTEVADLIIKNKNVDDSSMSYKKKSVLDFIRQTRIEPCFYYKGYLRAIIKGDFSSTIDEARFLFEGYIRPPTGTIRKIFVQYNAYRECPWETLLGNTGEDSSALCIQEVHIAEVLDLQEQRDEYYLDRKRKPFDFAKANKLYIEPQTYNYDELYFSSTDTKALLTPVDQATNIDLAQKLIEANINIGDLKSQLADKNANASFMMGSPTVEQCEPNSEQIVNDLKEQIKQLMVDNRELKEQLSNQTKSPAGEVQLNGIAKYNADKSYVISTSQALASYIWSMDTKKAIRTGDMVQQVRHVMHNVAPKLLPDDKAIREWLSGIAPDYAKKGGKTPKDAPSEVSLIMKK